MDVPLDFAPVVESGCQASNCHPTAPMAEYPPTSGKHTAHLQAEGLAEGNNVCNNCHWDYIYRPLHRNGVVEGYDSQSGRRGEEEIVYFGGTLTRSGMEIPVAGEFDTITDTCNNISCHNGASGLPWYGAGGSCTVCHSAGSSIDPLTTGGSSTSGKHIRHVQGQGIDCEVCHNDYPSNPTHMNGTYGKTEPGTIVYFGGSSGSIDPVTGTYDNGNDTCAVNDCHNAGYAPTVPWYGSGTGCTACHTAGLYNPMVTNGSGTNGRHTPHFTTAGVGCENCHDGYYPNAQHMNEVYNGKLENGSGVVALNGAWNSVTVGFLSGGDFTDNSANSTPSGVCANASCHGDPSSVDWYGALTGCTTCHKDGNAIDPLAGSGVSQNDNAAFGKHASHVTNAGIACETCHNGYNATSDHFDNTYNDANNTANTPRLVYFDPAVAGASATWDNINDGCSNLACHGDVSDWYTTAVSCTICHGQGDDRDPINGTGWAQNNTSTFGKHDAHVNGGGVACTTCHNNYPTTGDHRNGTIDDAGSGANTPTLVDFDNAIAGAGANWDNATDGCSNLDCHGDVSDWYSAGTGCLACHGLGDAIDPISGTGWAQNDIGINGKHKPHVTDNGIACETCHNGYADTADHGNGTNDDAFSGVNTPVLVNFDPAVAGAGATWDNSTDGCSSLACHSDAPDWYTTAGCLVCHGLGDAKDPINGTGWAQNNTGAFGKHDAHVNNGGIACQTCHSGYFGTTDHNNTVANDAFSGENTPVLVNFDPAAAGAGANWDNSTDGCSSLSCHGDVSDWYTTVPVCTTCHGLGDAKDPINGTGWAQNNTGAFGKHDAHVNNAGLACTTCHYGYYGTADHGNGTNDDADNTANTPVLVAFDPAVAGASAAWNNTTDGCSNLATGCHSDVSDWYIAQSPCNICHDVLDPARPESKSHPVHFGNGNIADRSGPAAAAGSPKYYYADERILGDLPGGLTGYYTSDNTISTADYMFGCGNCHPIDTANHFNGNVDVELYDVDGNANANSLKSKNTSSAHFDQGGTETCTNVYCHTSGKTSKESPAWGSGAMTHTFAEPKCDNCHDNPPRYVGDNTHLRDDTGGAYGYYREMGHFGSPNGFYTHGGGEVPMWGATATRAAAPITCQACHYNTVDAGNTIGIHYADTTGNYDIDGDGQPSCSFDADTPNTACHNPSSTTAGTYAVGGSLGAINTADKRLHVNGKGDVAFDTRTSTQSLPATYSGSGGSVTAGPYWAQITIPFDMSTPPPGSAVNSDVWSLNLSGAGYNPATKQCTNIPCHLRQTNGGSATYEPLSWSDALRCNVCHQQ